MRSACGRASEKSSRGVGADHVELEKKDEVEGEIAEEGGSVKNQGDRESGRASSERAWSSWADVEIYR